MKIDRALAAAALLLASGGLYAYQIVEGRYRVETSPGVFEDLLVVRCDDGRTLTVPWETKLAETCREGLMGEPLPKAAGTAARTAGAPPAEPTQKTAKPAPDAPATASAAALLPDEQTQKDEMLAQVRAQFGNVPEQYIEFKPGVDGLSMRFLPPLSDIVKKYETCRRARDLSADCAGERDRALTKLSDGTSQSAAAKPAKLPTASSKPQAAASSKPQAAASSKPQAATEMPAQPPRSAATGTAPAQPDPAAPAVQPAALAPLDRATAEQKIGEEYAWCLRAKPKFECEQARAKALSELDKPKAGKPKRPAKQASMPPKVATAQ